MARSCTVCRHEQRAAIDRALVDGESHRTVAARFALTHHAVGRHAKAHLPAAMAEAKQAEATASGDSLLDELARLRATAARVGTAAERAGDFASALRAVRELVRIVELVAELRSELDRRSTVNVLVSVEWRRVRLGIIDALAPFPEAALAVAEVLGSFDAGA